MQNHIKKILILIPTIGISIFSALFCYSSLLYPGGSQADLQSIGFDWANNYWCNLLSKKALNGQLNLARDFAVLGHITLCYSILVFLVQFPKYYIKSRTQRVVTQIFGVLAMSFAVLIFTDYHDLMTLIASILGLVAVAGVILGIYRNGATIFKWGAVVCVVLLVSNNVIYYSQLGIDFLPLIQKVTFTLVLLWIIGLNFSMLKGSRLSKN